MNCEKCQYYHQGTSYGTKYIECRLLNNQEKILLRLSLDYFNKNLEKSIKILNNNCPKKYEAWTNYGEEIAADKVKKLIKEKIQLEHKKIEEKK